MSVDGGRVTPLNARHLHLYTLIMLGCRRCTPGELPVSGKLPHAERTTTQRIRFLIIIQFITSSHSSRLIDDVSTFQTMLKSGVKGLT